MMLLSSLLALYLRLIGRRGAVLGLVGTLLLGVGLCLQLKTGAIFLAILPLLAAEAPALINDMLSSPSMAFGHGSIVCSLLGSAIIRRRAYPVWSGVLFILLGLCVPLQVVCSAGFASTIMASITYVILGSAFGAVGMRLLAGKPVVRADMNIGGHVAPGV